MNETQGEFPGWEPGDDIYYVQLCDQYLAVVKDNLGAIKAQKARAWTAGSSAFLYGILPKVDPRAVDTLQAEVMATHAMLDRVSPLYPSRFHPGYQRILDRALELRRYGGWERGIRTGYGWLQICLSAQGWLLGWVQWSGEVFESGEDFYHDPRREFSWLREILCISGPHRKK
jgi:hypothetical protein